MADKRVLITGADGFTGVHLSRELHDAGYRVFGMVKPGGAVGECTMAADLTSIDEVKRVVREAAPDCVVHLAGLSFVAHANEEDMYRVNLFGTLNLLESLAAWGGRPSKVLIASSANVYGAVRESVLDESICPRPVNHYGASKLAMEHIVATWFDRFPIVLLRPFNYTGTGQDSRFLIPKIVGHFARRVPKIELGNLDVEREFGDVRAVSRCYRALLESNAAGVTLNVCTGKAHSLRSIMDLMSEMAGYHIEIEVNPAFLRRNEIPRLVGSNRRLHDVIGEQRYPELHETLRWMYESATQRAG